MCSIIGVRERLHKVLGQIDLGTLDSVERSLPFGLLVIKFMQSLPKSTSIDVTLALTELYPIESETDYKKLVFLGQLCRLPGDHRVKEVFIHRLVHFNESPAKNLGFYQIYIVFA